MLTIRKQSLPGYAMRFGVDGHGVIVPILRKGKGLSLRPDLLVRALWPKWKHAFKLHAEG